MAIGFVRQATGSGTTSLSITITGAAAGNILVACVATTRTGTSTVASVSCTNVTWARLGGTVNSSLNTEIWYGIVSGGTSGTTISFTFSASPLRVYANVSEYSGLATTSPVDATTPVTKTGTGNPNTAAFSNANADDLIITCEGQTGTGTPSSQPAGYTALTFVTGASIGIQANYKIVSAAGAQSASWTIGYNWVSVMGALKMAAAAGGVPMQFLYYARGRA